MLHLPTVKPLDTESLLLAAQETRGIVTAEEHSILGGLGEAVAGFLSENQSTIVRRVGVRDVFGESGQAQELLDKYGLRARDIVRRLRWKGQVFKISGATGEGTEQLKNAVMSYLEANPRPTPQREPAEAASG